MKFPGFPSISDPVKREMSPKSHEMLYVINIDIETPAGPVRCPTLQCVCGRTFVARTWTQLGALVDTHAEPIYAEVG